MNWLKKIFNTSKKVPDSDLIETREKFIQFFNILTSDFGLKEEVKLSINTEVTSNLEVLYSCKRDDPMFHSFLETSVFNNIAIKNVQNMGFEKLILLDMMKHEFEDVFIKDLIGTFDT